MLTHDWGRGRGLERGAVRVLCECLSMLALAVQVALFDEDDRVERQWQSSPMAMSLVLLSVGVGASVNEALAWSSSDPSGWSRSFVCISVVCCGTQ